MITGGTHSVVEAANLIGARRLHGREIEVVNPASLDEIVGYAPVASAALADEAVRAAHDAFPDWRARSVEERAQALLTAADLLDETREERALLLVREQGKVLREAQREVDVLSLKLRQLAEGAGELFAVQAWQGGGVTSTLERRPRGVAVAIVPWNSPLSLMGGKVAGALVTGNTLVVKVPSSCPLTALWSLEVIAGALPDGVLSSISGSASEVGDALIRHPLVRTVSFTGSTESGRKVAAAAAAGVKKVVLELGGNDAAIVLADTPLTDRTLARLTWGFCLASGQICMAIRRLYVERPLYEELVGALADHLDTLVVGPGLDPSSDLGPLQNGEQVERHDALLAETLRAGGVVRECGSFAEDELPRRGHFRRPAIATGVEDDAEIVAEEQFSPLLPVLPFDTVDDAVARANATEYGLSSSVWSADEERARAVAARLESGLTFLNNHNLDGLDRRLPYGGLKQSGVGREGGLHGALEYLDLHGITNFDRVAHEALR